MRRLGWAEILLRCDSRLCACEVCEVCVVCVCDLDFGVSRR